MASLSLSSSAPSQSLVLVCRCTGLKPSNDSNKSVWKALKGTFSSQSKTKSGKWAIKLSQSEPFRPAGRPSSLNFAQIYTSEVLEDPVEVDPVDGSTLNPSLVAVVEFPDGMDP